MQPPYVHVRVCCVYMKIHPVLLLGLSVHLNVLAIVPQLRSGAYILAENCEKWMQLSVLFFMNIYPHIYMRDYGMAIYNWGQKVTLIVHVKIGVMTLVSKGRARVGKNRTGSKEANSPCRAMGYIHSDKISTLRILLVQQVHVCLLQTMCISLI